MAVKVHKSLRLDENLVKRVELLKEEGETLSNAMCRIMAIGCDTLEGGLEHAKTSEHDENTKKIISLLENENERLRVDHEADRKALAEKDEQLARALDKAHDLAEQAHVLTGRAQELKALPNTDDEKEIVDITPAPEKIGFWDWWKNYR